MTPPYYMVECFVPQGKTVVDILDYPLIDGIDSWLTGARFKVLPPTPIQLEWDPATTGIKKRFYDATIPLFHHTLVSALRTFGLDNLDCYPVEITNKATGEIDSDYSAVNVIGLVAAADLEKSNCSDHSRRGLIDVDFDGLCLLDDAGRGLLLFRLAECVSGLAIHKDAKRFLESTGEFGLTFVPPEQWIG